MSDRQRAAVLGLADRIAAQDLKRPYEQALAAIQQGLARTNAIHSLGRDAEAVQKQAAQHAANCEAVRVRFAADIAEAPTAVSTQSIIRDFERALDEARKKAERFLHVDERQPMRAQLSASERLSI